MCYPNTGGIERQYPCKNSAHPSAPAEVSHQNMENTREQNTVAPADQDCSLIYGMFVLPIAFPASYSGLVLS